jgi:hypothetical protein
VYRGSYSPWVAGIQLENTTKQNEFKNEKTDAIFGFLNKFSAGTNFAFDTGSSIAKNCLGPYVN